MDRAAVLMGIVVLLCPHSSTPDFNEGWGDYLQDEVELDNADLKQGYTPNYSQNRYSEGLPTVLYDQSKSWSLHNDVPFAVLMYKSNFRQVRGETCGGVLLTPTVIMSLCSCVASYLSWVHGGREVYEKAPFAVNADLGQEIFVKINFGRYSEDWSDDRWHTELFVHSNVLVDRSTGQQLKNDRCMEVFKGATARFKRTWEQHTTIALLKMSQDHVVNYTYDAFVPWPPVPLTYDLTLKDKLNYESNLWGLHQSRAIETVSISSLGFKLHRVVSKVWYDNFGVPIDPRTNRLKFRTTMCDQDFCVNGAFPEIERNVKGEERKKFTCFCDENDRDTLCEGEVGTAVMHDGILHGLLILPIQCRTKSPRDTAVVNIDGPTIDWITTNVPELRQRVLESINASQFREEELVGNYEIYIPRADLLPSDAVFNEEFVGPGARSAAIPVYTSPDVQMFLQFICTALIFIISTF